MKKINLIFSLSTFKVDFSLGSNDLASSSEHFSSLRFNGRPAGRPFLTSFSNSLTKFKLVDFSLLQTSSSLLVDFKETSFPKLGKRRFCFPVTGSTTFFLRKRLHRLLRNRLLGLQGSIATLYFMQFLTILSPFVLTTVFHLKFFLFNCRVLKFFPKRFRKLFVPRLFAGSRLQLSTFAGSISFSSSCFWYFFTFFTNLGTIDSFYILHTLFFRKTAVLSRYPLTFFKKRVQKTVLTKSILPLISSPSFKPFFKKKRKNASIR